MTDRWAIFLAVATAIGATAAAGPSPVVGALVIALAFFLRRPWLLCLGAALLASALGARAWAGLDPRPLGRLPRPFAGAVTLVSDPRPTDDGTRVDVRAGRHRFEARARGAAAARLGPRLAGERVALQGTIRPSPPRASWRARRHIVAELLVSRVGDWASGSAVTRLANGVRRTLLHGARSLDRDQRALFTGFVLGDDRDQPPAIAADFRASGLVHLLVVSGQNVAFVLALASPLLIRLRLGPRLAVTIGVIGLFALVTRFEPSVLRASAMAAIAALAATLGRDASSIRLLALAVTGLLLVDPFLVRSLGFRLSVAASAGIVLFARRLAELVPGPRAVASAAAVTVAAQLAVAPVLVPAFGGLPAASFLANVLAAPASGPLMMWGMTAGLAAGLMGGGVAEVLHVPTRLLLTWEAGVARVSAKLPLGELRLAHVAVMGLALGVGALTHRRQRLRWLRGPGYAVGVVALVAPAAALAVAPPPPLAQPLEGAVLWRAGGGVVLVVDGRGWPDDVLDALHRHQVRRIDAVIVRSSSPRAARLTGALVDRYRPPAVYGPVGIGVASARVPPARSTLTVGGLAVLLRPEGTRLDVVVTDRSTRARSPPQANVGALECSLR